ncbi:hypothetical protein BU23DRAFT_571823 [Bimuria novae-zelandiae CBS 107.79]|uniref:Uncharacterized protein n=1 Tax=Bimuria novae-zelandiae CBS 107.79 TaxID=1447943 RepID=A0A6A5UWJ5_9PLEO|nr:hypothetical protein BU23DRAFT_571823 [Bimuria novae-zelandiae CBS 107.79]
MASLTLSSKMIDPKFNSQASNDEQTRAPNPPIYSMEQCNSRLSRYRNHLNCLKSDYLMGKPPSLDVTLHEPLDISHVREKFAQADQCLVERLGKAISHRRHYLRYRANHKEYQEQNSPEKAAVDAVDDT